MGAGYRWQPSFPVPGSPAGESSAGGGQLQLRGMEEEPEEAEARPTLGVGAVVVRDDALLMVKRAHEPGRGLWSLPGGRVEHGEHLSAAVAREVREETGLEIEVGDLLGIYEVVGGAVADPQTTAGGAVADQRPAQAPGSSHFVVLDFLAEVTGDATPAAGHDADDVRWVPFESIGALRCTPRLEETLSGWGVFGDPAETGHLAGEEGN